MQKPIFNFFSSLLLHDYSSLLAFGNILREDYSTNDFTGNKYYNKGSKKMGRGVIKISRAVLKSWGDCHQQ